MKSNLIVLLMSLALSTQLPGQSRTQLIENFRQETQASILINNSTGVPGFVKLPSAQTLELSGNTAEQKSTDFFQSRGVIFGMKDASQEMTLSKETTDNIGFNHLTYLQTYKGVPVFDGQLKMHYNSLNELQSVNGVFIPDLKLNPIPSMSASDASVIAIQYIENIGISTSSSLRSKHEKLYIFRKGLVQGINGGNHLVFEVEVVDEVGLREFVYVDAHSGDIVERFTGNHGALFRRLYEGSTANEIWTEGDAFPGGLDIWQRNEIEAAGHTYYTFFNSFGFDSYDGAGAEMLTINNVTTPGFCPNASWNGVTARYCTGTASDDVVAHEWGHAYTEFTSDLIYAWQPGALNESYSDIWGETVDLLNNYQDAGEDLSLRTDCTGQRWRMGEDASAFGGAIRDMYMPNCDNDPGKVSDVFYVCGTGDSGGVHTNSGVNNHAYSLLVDGGTYNGQTITGIGLVKAAHIFWRSQSEYLTRSSGFDVQADALEQSASDLLGINLEGISTTSTPFGPSGEMISAADTAQLVKVLLAVEMRTEPSCIFTPILAASALTCQESLPLSAIFYEDFESGLGAWTATEHPVNPGTWESRFWVLEPDLPDDRPTTGVFGINPINGDCITDLQNGIIRLESPVINIPGFTTGAIEMSFDHNVSTEFQWDGANIKYNLNGGGWTILPGSAFTLNPYNDVINTVGAGNDNPMEGEEAFTGTDGGQVDGSWGISTIDLTGLGLLPGGNIQFRFEVGGDGCNGSSFGWYIDDVRIYVCLDCTTNVINDLTYTVEHTTVQAEVDIATSDEVTGTAEIIYSAPTIDFTTGFEVSGGGIIETNNDGCETSPAVKGENEELRK